MRRRIARSARGARYRCDDRDQMHRRSRISGSSPPRSSRVSPSGRRAIWGFQAPLFVVWKGVCVGLLTLCAGLAARDRNGWLITGGPVRWARSAMWSWKHPASSSVAWRSWRGIWSRSCCICPIGGHAGGALGDRDRPGDPRDGLRHYPRDVGATVYAAGLGSMAGAAWYSRFPRTIVATGALMFAVSDLLIFSELGPLKGSILPAPDDLAALSRRPDADRLWRAENPRSEEAQ